MGPLKTDSVREFPSVGSGDCTTTQTLTHLILKLCDEGCVSLNFVLVECGNYSVGFTVWGSWLRVSDLGFSPEDLEFGA